MEASALPLSAQRLSWHVSWRLSPLRSFPLFLWVGPLFKRPLASFKVRFLFCSQCKIEVEYKIIRRNPTTTPHKRNAMYIALT